MADKSVVIGFDGSPESLDALALARVLIRATGARTHLAMVFGDDKQKLSTADFFKSTLELAEPLMSTNFEVHAVDDLSVGAGLNSVVEEEDASILVIGSSQWGPIGRVRLGDVGATFSQGLGCDLLIAPRGYSRDGKEEIKDIGIAYGGTEQCDVALRRGIELMGELDASGTLVGVVPQFHKDKEGTPSSDEFSRKLRSDMESILQRAVERSGRDLEIRIEDGDVADGLARASADFDLMVVGSRGYGPTGRVMLGGTGLSLARSAASPLLLVPRDE